MFLHMVDIQWIVLDSTEQCKNFMNYQKFPSVAIIGEQQQNLSLCGPDLYGTASCYRLVLGRHMAQRRVGPTQTS